MARQRRSPLNPFHGATWAGRYGRPGPRRGLGASAGDLSDAEWERMHQAGTLPADWAAEDEEIEEEVACPQCGGPGGLLGKLGAVEWHSCRNCGWEWPEGQSQGQRGRAATGWVPGRGTQGNEIQTLTRGIRHVMAVRGHGRNPKWGVVLEIQHPDAPGEWLFEDDLIDGVSLAEAKRVGEKALARAGQRGQRGRRVEAQAQAQAKVFPVGTKWHVHVQAAGLAPGAVAYLAKDGGVRYGDYTWAETTFSSRKAAVAASAAWMHKRG